MNTKDKRELQRLNDRFDTLGLDHPESRRLVRLMRKQQGYVLLETCRLEANVDKLTGLLGSQELAAQAACEAAAYHFGPDAWEDRKEDIASEICRVYKEAAEAAEGTK